MDANRDGVMHPPRAAGARTTGVMDVDVALRGVTVHRAVLHTVHRAATTAPTAQAADAVA
jgi:hypothetical protein